MLTRKIKTEIQCKSQQLIQMNSYIYLINCKVSQRKEIYRTDGEKKEQPYVFTF